MLRQAVILAGGMGTRLGALTANTPKPLLKVGGQPFVEYLLKHLTRHGVEHIVLLVGPHESHYRQHFRTNSNSNVQVDFVSDIPPAGTGGALRYARNLLDDRFLLLNGDSYFDFNLLDLTADQGTTARIALRRVADTARYGHISLEGERVLKFEEKSKGGEGLINAGVYWLHRSIVDELKDGVVSIESQVFPKLAENGRLTASAYDGAFIDIGVPEDLNRAQSLMPDWQRRPAAFLDRDGIINHDTGYVWRREEYQWIAGADRAIKRLNDLGYYVFVVTNQAGVARGLYRTSDVEALHTYINETLRRKGAHIDAFYYCPFHPDFGGTELQKYRNWRKPKPGMLLRAMEEWPVDLARSFMIGDKETDMQAADAAGVPNKRLFIEGDVEAAMAAIAPPLT